MRRVVLSPRLDFDGVARLLKDWPEEPEGLVVQLARDQWVEPEGLVALACLIRRHAERTNGKIELDWSACPDRVGYWERMGFFAAFGLESPGFTDPLGAIRGRFSELLPVSLPDDVDDVAETVLSAIDLEGEARKICQHIVTESLNNVVQHSGTAGFCLAQYYGRRETVKLCIGDWGVGLLGTLSGRGARDDLQAIELALEVGVTGSLPRLQQREMRNRGIGLTAIERLVKANRGTVQISSGRARVRVGPDGLARRVGLARWPGVLLVAALRRKQILTGVREILRQLDEELRAKERAVGTRPIRRIP